MKAKIRLFAAILGLNALAAIGAAQSVNGLEIFRQIGNDGPRHDFGDDGLFQGAVRGAWQHALPLLDKAVEGALAANNRNLPHKVTVYYQHSHLNANPVVDATLVDGGHTVHIHVTLPNNSVLFHLTQPSFIGKSGDPKLSVNYDAVLDALIPIPTLVQPLSVQRVTFEIRNAKIEGHNVVGSVGVAASDIVHFFGGPDFKGQIEHKIDQERDFTGPMNDALGPVNRKLQKLASQGYSQLTSRVENAAHELILQAVRPK